MQRYVIRMFADDWKQWVPAIAVVAVMATMIGLCVHQFAQIEPAHLLVELLAQPDGVAAGLLAAVYPDERKIVV